jgi:hypothetical protein
VRFIDAYPLTRDLARTTNVHLGPGYPTYAERVARAVSQSQGSSSVAWVGGLLLVGAWVASLGLAASRPLSGVRRRTRLRS